MRVGAIISALAIALVGAACGPMYETVYDYNPPPTAEGRLCASQCTQIANLCRQNCELKEQRCLSDARQRGAWAYEDYVREQQARKEPITRSIDDFTYDSDCYTASSCKSECMVSHNQCFTTCGGAVTSRQVCTAFCK
jgi:hypothetical protein